MAIIFEAYISFSQWKILEEASFLERERKWNALYVVVKKYCATPLETWFWTLIARGCYRLNSFLPSLACLKKVLWSQKEWSPRIWRQGDDAETRHVTWRPDGASADHSRTSRREFLTRTASSPPPLPPPQQDLTFNVQVFATKIFCVPWLQGYPMLLITRDQEWTKPMHWNSSIPLVLLSRCTTTCSLVVVWGSSIGPVMVIFLEGELAWTKECRTCISMDWSEEDPRAEREFVKIVLKGREELKISEPVWRIRKLCSLVGRLCCCLLRWCYMSGDYNHPQASSLNFVSYSWIFAMPRTKLRHIHGFHPQILSTISARNIKQERRIWTIVAYVAYKTRILPLYIKFIYRVKIDMCARCMSAHATRESTKSITSEDIPPNHELDS